MRHPAKTIEIVRVVAFALVLSSCSAGINLPEPLLMRTSVGLRVSTLWTRASAVVVGDLRDARMERGRVSDLYPCIARIHVRETFKGVAPPEGAQVLWYSTAPDCSHFGALSTPPGLPPGAWESIYFLRSEAGWLRPIVDDRGSVAFVTGIRAGQRPGASILADALADGRVLAKGARRHCAARKPVWTERKCCLSPLIPAVCARPGMVVRKVVPCRAVGTVVFAHGAPLPLA
jgi:hypothetical protein